MCKSEVGAHGVIKMECVVLFYDARGSVWSFLLKSSMGLTVNYLIIVG